MCENFKTYFVMSNHELRTRNNRFMVKLPVVKLNIAKKSFYYAGAKIYNDLPLAIRRLDDYNSSGKPNLKVGVPNKDFSISNL